MNSATEFVIEKKGGEFVVTGDVPSTIYIDLDPHGDLDSAYIDNEGDSDACDLCGGYHTGAPDCTLESFILDNLDIVEIIQQLFSVEDGKYRVAKEGGAL